MGIEKIRRPLLAMAGIESKGNIRISTNASFREDIESLTGSSVAQTISAYGVTFITYGTSGKTNDFIIPDPPAAGIDKKIFFVNNTTSV